MGRAGQKCQGINAVEGIPQPVIGWELVGKYSTFLPLRIEGTSLSVFQRSSVTHSSNLLNSIPYVGCLYFPVSLSHSPPSAS